MAYKRYPFFRPLMPRDAPDARGVVGVWSFAVFHVLLLGYGSKVRRPYAGRVVADVVDDKTVRDGTICHLI
jgi:hypothetical protein